MIAESFLRFAAFPANIAHVILRVHVSVMSLESLAVAQIYRAQFAHVRRLVLVVYHHVSPHSSLRVKLFAADVTRYVLRKIKSHSE